MRCVFMFVDGGDCLHVCLLMVGIVYMFVC